MQPISPADITGDGHQHTLSSILGITSCRWFAVSGINITNPAGAVGDSTIEAVGGGVQILPSVPVIFPPVSLPMAFYDLTQWYIKLTLNDTASVAAVI